jgi:hypothetical protein
VARHNITVGSHPLAATSPAAAERRMNVERLTKRQAFTVGGVIYAKCEHCQDKRPECFGEQCPVPDEALISLAAYEDTGLSPTDIADLRNELCLKCGKYKTAHEGSCDGCRWKGAQTLWRCTVCL